MTASPTPLFAESANKSDGEHYADRAYCSDAQVGLPSEEEIAKLISGAPFPSTKSITKARAVLALFAPILAEKERVERAPYSIGEPEGGWRNHGSFSREEKAKLRPVAETLAMLDGNAFFGNEVSAGAEWYEQYLPEAHALYEGNGGDSGWAGEASFAKPDARALAAEAALAAERANAVDGSIDIRLDDKGGIDEIFGNGVLCHIERMNRGGWFIILTRPDQSQEAFWLTGKGKVEFTLHEHRNAPTTGPNVEPWAIAAAIRAQGE